MKVMVEFIRRGRTVHTREFEVKSVDLFIKRLDSQFIQYRLLVDEIDICGMESTDYDKCIHGQWYRYTGRMIYTRSIYGSGWWYEYVDSDGNTEYF
jgi:hypothetical protein